MLEIQRIQRPDHRTIENAYGLCAREWPHLASLATPERFRAFEARNVELIVSRDARGHMNAVCFALPDSIAGHQFMWLCDFVAEPEARGAGALVLLEAMQSYPNVLSVGVTAPAEALYRRMKWNCHNDLWRCVCPLSLDGVLHQYGSRLSHRSRRLLRLAWPLFSGVVKAGEFVVGGAASVKKLPDHQFSCVPQSLQLAAKYTSVLGTTRGGVVFAVNRAGVGRLLTRVGCPGIRAQLRLRRALRCTGAVVTELLVNSRAQAIALAALGYVPARMPLFHYGDCSAFDQLQSLIQSGDFSLLNSDKVL